MIKLLEEIDEMLAAMECVAHGMEGRAITEMRGRIQTELSKSHKPVVSGKRPEQDLRDFFIWAVRVAKIEVIDAENAIELTGYWKEDAPLVPVLSLDELIQEYQAATDTELYKETKT